MKQKYVLSLIAVAVVVLFTGERLYAQAPAAKETKSEKLLKEVKAAYKPLQAPASFIISYTGKELQEIKVVTVEAGSSIATVVEIAAGNEVNLTPEVMRKLLVFNSHADFIKASIGDDGGIRVQGEHDFTSMSAKFFGELLDQVAAGADEVAGIIRPVRKKPTEVK